MNRRLFPSSHLHPWGLVFSNQRCPRCHVHRFEAEVTRKEYDSLLAGETDSVFVPGHCERCGLKETYLIYADGRVVRLV